MNKKKEKPRIRQYPEGYKGKIIVFVHAIKSELSSKKIYKHAFEKFKSVSHVEVVNNHKLKIVLGESETADRAKAIEEANSLAKSLLKNHRFYIPAKFAETQGVISWPKGQDTEDFLLHGKGKFNNNLMSEVKVLEVTRLLKKSNEASKDSLEETGTVIVTFAGSILPHKLACEGLIVPVREYRRKEMFCINCKKYGHTEKMCNNKKVENEIFKCIQCKTNDHENGSVTCPRRKIIESRRYKIEKKLHQRTYAEILKELDPTNTMPNELSEEVEVAPIVFASRKQWSEQVKQKEAKKNSASSSKRVHQQKQSTSKGLPPGFQKAENKDESVTESILSFITSVMQDLKVPEPIQQIVITYSKPFLDKFITKITNTFMNKLSEF